MNTGSPLAQSGGLSQILALLAALGGSQQPRTLTPLAAAAVGQGQPDMPGMARFDPAGTGAGWSSQPMQPAGRPPFDIAGDTRNPDGSLFLGAPASGGIPTPAVMPTTTQALASVEAHRAQQHPHAGLHPIRRNTPAGAGGLGGFYTPANAPASLQQFIDMFRRQHHMGGARPV